MKCLWGSWRGLSGAIPETSPLGAGALPGGVPAPRKAQSRADWKDRTCPDGESGQAEGQPRGRATVHGQCLVPADVGGEPRPSFPRFGQPLKLYARHC